MGSVCVGHNVRVYVGLYARLFRPRVHVSFAGFPSAEEEEWSGREGRRLCSHLTHAGVAALLLQEVNVNTSRLLGFFQC